MTGLQLDYATDHHLLVFWPCSQFLIHLTVYLSILQQLLCDNLIRNSANGLTEVQEDNIHCFPLIYQTTHFIIQVYQISRA